jgi:nucleotide-binding universal stress UspA family protein
LVVVAAPDSSGALSLGSVYLALASAGPCPVVVVPPKVETLPSSGPIVCGVDGADPSRTAARVAADLTCRLDAQLKLVHVRDALPAAEPVGSQGMAATFEEGTTRR